MAIYTNYARYLKAKQFKEFLEEQGDIYMLFGLGNPEWDDLESSQNVLPIAPYNMSVTKKLETQFADTHWAQYCCSADNSQSYKVEIDTGLHDTYADKCKNLIPAFPCIWQYSDDDKDTIAGKKQSEYQDYYIIHDNNKYYLKQLSNSATLSEIPFPTTNIKEQQYFAELYLRGKALNFSFPDAAWRTPDGETGSLTFVNKTIAGLLGAIKCDVSFVKDIGDDSNNKYSGKASQFWYGDRYWEIVEPDDTHLENYISSEVQSGISYKYTDDSQIIYPNHLIITATVNPRKLCEELNIDQAIVPRQIAIYTRRKLSTDLPPNEYRVGEYLFNFGQYSIDQLPDATSTFTPTKNAREKVLNFTLPCKTGTGSNQTEYPNGEFKFVLHDYIKGSVREDKHAIDRFGYVIGF